MHYIFNPIVISLWLTILIVFRSSAQQTISPDSQGQKTAAQNLESYFNIAVKQQSKLFNGPFYEFYSPQITGSAYFKDSQEFTKGSVVYDGFLYENVPLLYDLYRDVLVSVFYEGNFKFNLISEKVSQFKIDDHKFVYLNKDLDATKSIKKTGFYDLLYDGKIKVYSKRAKLMQEANDTRYVRRFFVSKNNYFVERDKIMIPFGKLGTFLSLFKNEKAEMRKFLKKNELKFKDDPERTIVLLAGYYDALTN